MNPEPLLNLGSARARQARLAKSIGQAGYELLVVAGLLLLAAAAAVWYLKGFKTGLLLVSPAVLCLLPATWWSHQLKPLPPDGDSLNDRLSGDVLARLKSGTALNPRSVWIAISSHWQAGFFTHHLLLPHDLIAQSLSENETDMAPALRLAEQLADQNHSPTVELGFVVAGLLLSSPQIKQLLSTIRAKPEDVESIAAWLGRNLESRATRRYGGIGRDWAFGFTPQLDRFGHNLSRSIMQHGSNFGWLAESPGVQAVEAAFANHAAAVILLGPDGIGKTQSAYALAQKLIEGGSVRELAFHQIIELNATDITSRAQRPGDLENIMISLANEAGRAGHIILFLDDAQLFLSNGPGSFDATQILLSIIQARAAPLILAMTPGDFQRLKNQNQSLASLLTPVVLQELPEASIMSILEDVALGLENRNRVLVAYEALREAYRLSGRYTPEEAYPGKAIKLLERSVTHAQGQVVNAKSVQQAIEQTHGVKVSSAAPAEADQLLHLEDAIHQRMINQSHAVQVVASALRRARAGVTNPRRPIGSFLFLGPTGVGKTELARSVAATYFGSESSMVRLDMSEYQQPDDVQRLLSTGSSDNASLLMSIRQQPFAVVLLDELEKAHPNILNLLLQLLDEGQLTDSSGRPASFKDAVIIATSNAGAQTIRERIGRGESLDSFADQLTDELINSGQFKPELLNRFDEMVFFRPLTADELAQVVTLMVAEVNQTLQPQNISIELTPAAIQKIVAEGNDPRLGARPMRRVLQRVVENTVAQKILKGEARPGDRIRLDADDLA